MLGAGRESLTPNWTAMGDNLHRAPGSLRPLVCDSDRDRAHRRMPRVRRVDWTPSRAPSTRPMMPNGGSTVFCPVPEPAE